ncbi:MAG: polysaccharide biosynthesis/export family protein, partial [Pseudomonadota bacterium]
MTTVKHKPPEYARSNGNIIVSGRGLTKRRPLSSYPVNGQSRFLRVLRAQSHEEYLAGAFRGLFCLSPLVPKISRFAFLVLIALIAGCMAPRHRVVINETPMMMIQKVTNHFPAPLYRLSPGDLLEFLYLTVPTVTPTAYIIGVRDQIDVEFAFHPEYNRTVRVRPDGKISLPRKPELKIAGLTADQVKEKLQAIYSDLFKDPEITITVREFNARLTEIQKAIATAPFGQAREIRIRPDGFVSLPLIPNL